MGRPCKIIVYDYKIPRIEIIETDLGRHEIIAKHTKITAVYQITYTNPTRDDR
jgi:hypothetical protein